MADHSADSLVALRAALWEHQQVAHLAALWVEHWAGKRVDLWVVHSAAPKAFESVALKVEMWVAWRVAMLVD